MRNTATATASASLSLSLRLSPRPAPAVPLTPLGDAARLVLPCVCGRHKQHGE
jgi:hypothetical protein